MSMSSESPSRHKSSQLFSCPSLLGLASKKSKHGVSRPNRLIKESQPIKFEWMNFDSVDLRWPRFNDRAIYSVVECNGLGSKRQD